MRTALLLATLALAACGRNPGPQVIYVPVTPQGYSQTYQPTPSWQPLYAQVPTSMHCVFVRPGYQSCSAQ